MKNMPPRVRSYAAYEHTLDQLKRYYDSVKVRISCDTITFINDCSVVKYKFRLELNLQCYCRFSMQCAPMPSRTATGRSL